MFLRLSLSCTRSTSLLSTCSLPRPTGTLRLLRNVQQLHSKPHLSGLSRGFTSSSSYALKSGSNANAVKFRLGRLGGAALVASVGLGLAATQPILCDPPNTTASPTVSPASIPDAPSLQQGPTSSGSSDGLPSLPPPPKSSLNMFELSFGAVCGICTGVFVKKGAKLLAFFFGGVFVILQYLASINLIRVNWSGAQSRFDKAFNSTDVATGASKPPTVYTLWNWLVNFLAADFPPRATFIAGLLLGIRIG